MSEPTRNRRKPAVVAFLLSRIGLGILALMGITLSLAGSLAISSRSWREGQVAPYTVYAPFAFSSSDPDRPVEAPLRGTSLDKNVVEVERGELLVSRGERLTAAQVACLTALDQSKGRRKSRSQWFGAFLLAGLITAIGAIYLRRYEPKVWKSPSQLLLTTLLLGLLLGISRMVLTAPFDVAWVPVAAGSMLLGMLLGPRLGILLGLLATGIVGLMTQTEIQIVAGLSVGCFVGAYAVQGIRRRIDFFRAGLWTGLAQGATIFAGYLIIQWPIREALSHSLAGFFSGLLFSSIITFCLLPICESLFSLVTEVTLLELSDLNHPLLKDLSVKAPGTYHHSLIVANLAEGACLAVGANGLLARVGCYFHDVGKMLHPEYFVENQPPDSSRHDRLSPSMSSLVILSHVKEGIKLARRHRLNQAIVDFIPGHHGTGLIYYFYRRALEEVEDEALLKEERFRYPGPKPQSRETAIALLSDSAEAATRALSQKSAARIQEVVRRIINNKFIDGQLDQCDLTLRDLNRIEEAFVRVLAGIYHPRVEYPRAPGEEELTPGQEQAKAG